MIARFDAMCRTPLLAILLASLTGIPATLSGDVVVLANRAPEAVAFTLKTGSDKRVQHRKLGPGRTLAVPLREAVHIRFQHNGRQQAFHLPVNCAYEIDTYSDGAIRFTRLDLGGGETTQPLGLLPANHRPPTLKLRLLVDDDQRAAAALWQERLRRRVQAASRVLEQQCGLALAIEDFGTWTTNDAETDLTEVFASFTKRVDPGDAHLAIGFTSQFAIAENGERLGIDSGLLGRHILIRERGPTVTGAERAEGLVHYLGRYLGAIASNDSSSVMRSDWADGRARRADLAIEFDPVNALIVNLVAQQLRSDSVSRIVDLSRKSRHRLDQIYRAVTPKRQVAQSDREASTNPAASIDDSPPSGKAPAETDGSGAAPAPAEKDAMPLPQPEAGSAPHAAPPARASPELARILRGSWKAVSARRRKKDYQIPERLKYRFDGGRLTVSGGGFGTFRFDVRISVFAEPAAGVSPQPGHVDLTLRLDDRTIMAKGIFRWDGEQLLACIAMPGEPRPRDFETDKDGKRAVLVLQRE